MRAVFQRVAEAQVVVEQAVVGEIGAGACVFVGVGRDDSEDDAAALAGKVVGLRVFVDDQGRMNRSLLDTGGALLAVSQFTLHGDVRRGKRPSFTEAMEPGRANDLFECFCRQCRALGADVQTGRFRAHMMVDLVNDGPVTILLDTKKAF
jgi:D-tyrosyl-tRNA(Tyr) deacylase